MDFEQQLIDGEITLLVCGKHETIDATTTYPWSAARQRLMESRALIVVPDNHAAAVDRFDAIWASCAAAVGLDPRSIPEILGQYVLDPDGTVRQEPSMARYMEFSMDHSKSVIDSTYVDDVHVSTVFLRNTGEFETMVFGGSLNEYQVRYDSVGDAKIGHGQMVDRARAAAAWFKDRRHKKWYESLQRWHRLAEQRGIHWAYRHLNQANRMFARARRSGMESPRLDPFYGIMSLAFAASPSMLLNILRTRLSDGSIASAGLGSLLGPSPTSSDDALATDGETEPE